MLIITKINRRNFMVAQKIFKVYQWGFGRRSDVFIERNWKGSSSTINLELTFSEKLLLLSEIFMSINYQRFTK